MTGHGAEVILSSLEELLPEAPRGAFIRLGKTWKNNRTCNEFLHFLYDFASKTVSVCFYSNEM